MKDLSRTLFITDMDGTLLMPDKTINPTDMAAMERFRSMGGHFSVATGRSLQSARQYFEALKLDEPIIVCNGGGIYDCGKGEYVWQQFVDRSAYDVIKKVYDKFPDVGMEVNFSDRIVALRLTEEEKYHIKISYGTDFEMGSIDDLELDGWCKILFAANEQRIPELAEFIRDIGNGSVDYVRSSRIFYEMLPKNCVKGKTLTVLKDICLDENWTVVSCGDYDNDLEMIKVADYGFAPSNALDCVKEAAYYVTKADCGSGAVAEAINYLIDIL